MLTIADNPGTDVIDSTINTAAGGFGEGSIDEEAEAGAAREAKRERKKRIRIMRGTCAAVCKPVDVPAYRLRIP